MKITRTKITASSYATEEGFERWLIREMGISKSDVSPAKWEELGTRFFPIYRSECEKHIDENILSSKKVRSSESTTKWWMAKYWPVEGEVKKVYFEGPKSIHRAEKDFESWIPVAYKKMNFLGSVPNVSDTKMKDEGFEKVNIYSSTYVDTDGCIAGKGRKISTKELKELYEELHEYDPVVAEYKSFEEWMKDTVDSGYLREVSAEDNLDETVYEDTSAMFYPDINHRISLSELEDIYGELHEYDPVVQDYDTFDAWLKDTVDNGYLREVRASRSDTVDWHKDRRLAPASLRYRGYLIVLDRGGGGYNIYDKNRELEDAGYSSIDTAKQAVDEIIEDIKGATCVKSSRWIDTMTKVIRPKTDYYYEHVSSLSDDDIEIFQELGWIKDSNHVVIPAGTELRYQGNDGRWMLYQVVGTDYIIPFNNTDDIFYKNFDDDFDDVKASEEIEEDIGFNEWLFKYYGVTSDDMTDDDYDYYWMKYCNAVGLPVRGAEEVETADYDSEYDLDQVEQEFTSKNTSINSGKLPAIYNMVNFQPGQMVLDYGGGKFDNGSAYLAGIGAIGCIYDPYNRTTEHNRAVVRQIRDNGGADVALCSNVLNVIKEPEARLTALKNIRKLLKPSGKVYITVHEGDRSGEARQSQKDAYQLHRKTKDYMDEIKRVFPDATRKGKLIVATPTGEITASTDVSIRDRIYDYLDETQGCAKYEEMIQEISDRFGVSPDKVEEYLNDYSTSCKFSEWYDDESSIDASTNVCADKYGYSDKAARDPWAKRDEINLPAYAVKWVAGYAGNGVNRYDYKYFRTEEERDEFVEKLKDRNAMDIQTWKADNFYHTLPDDKETVESSRTYKTRHPNYCPHCTNMTLVEIEDGYYVCDECGSEFEGYPAFEGGLELTEVSDDVEASQKIEAKLVEPPQDVVDELISILSEYGFELDDRFETNPGRTWMDNIHLQVINKNSHVDESDPQELRRFVTRELIDKIDDLDRSSNCPITWSFGADQDGHVTGGLDIDKQWVEDEVSESVESSTNVECAESNLDRFKDQLEYEVYRALEDYIMVDQGRSDPDDLPDYLEVEVVAAFEGVELHVWCDGDEEEIYKIVEPIVRKYDSDAAVTSDDDWILKAYIEVDDSTRKIQSAIIYTDNPKVSIDTSEIDDVDEWGKIVGKPPKEKYQFVTDYKGVKILRWVSGGDPEPSSHHVKTYVTAYPDGKLFGFAFDSLEEAKQAIDTYESEGRYVFSSSCIESASYGGAYDIEDDQYFTKEEIVEFGDDVADAVSEATGHAYHLSDAYVDGKVLSIEVTDNDITNEGSVSIDFRRIVRPKDIYKYKDTLVKQLVDAHYEYYEEDEIDHSIDSACAVEASIAPDADIQKVMMRAVNVTNHAELLDILSDVLSIDEKLYRHACDMDQQGDSPATIGKMISNELYRMLDKNNNVEAACDSRKKEDIEAAAAPFKKKEFMKQLSDELYNTASEIMQGEAFGFPLDDIADYLVIEVNETSDGVVAEVRAELDYEDMSLLADALNPIVQRYDKDSYFDMVDSGIMEAFIGMKFIDNSILSAQHINYDDPIDIDKTFEVEFDVIVAVKDNVVDYDGDPEFNSIEYDDYGFMTVEDGGDVAEHILELIGDFVPEEDGKYRVSGIANLKYEITDIYSVYNDPDRITEEGYFGYETNYAQSEYDSRSSWVENLQCEKI